MGDGFGESVNATRDNNEVVPDAFFEPDVYQQMTEINLRFIGRRSRGKLAKWCMIYPDDLFTTVWDSVSR